MHTIENACTVIGQISALNDNDQELLHLVTEYDLMDLFRWALLSCRQKEKNTVLWTLGNLFCSSAVSDYVIAQPNGIHLNVLS